MVLIRNNSGVDQTAGLFLTPYKGPIPHFFSCTSATSQSDAHFLLYPSRYLLVSQTSLHTNTCCARVLSSLLLCTSACWHLHHSLLHLGPPSSNAQPWFLLSSISCPRQTIFWVACLTITRWVSWEYTSNMCLMFRGREKAGHAYFSLTPYPGRRNFSWTWP